MPPKPESQTSFFAANQVAMARLFATAAHAATNQRRRYTDEPYIVHPIEVAQIVGTVAHTQDMLAAAFLHDVVEDTFISLEMIQAEFGTSVAALVDWLTERREGENRAARKALDCQRWGHAPNDAKTIKCADILSNLPSILEHDRKFAKVYLKEKTNLFPSLVGADEILLNQVANYLETYKEYMLP